MQGFITSQLEDPIGWTQPKLCQSRTTYQRGTVE
jgi:hypothetical protein